MPFETLRETLLRGGIAPRHVRRYLRELDDHLADLIEAQSAAGHDEEDATARALALLGSEKELAAAMLAQPGFKSWMARLPWAVFGLAPPLLMLMAFFATALPVVLLGDFVSRRGSIAEPEWFQALAHGTVLFANLALGPGLAALLVAAALRQRLNWKWPLLASAVIAVAGVHMFALFPRAPRGQISIGVLVEASHDFGPNLAGEMPILLAQFFLTLAPALWLLWHRRFASPAEAG